MQKHKKLLQTILLGRSDANVAFNALCHMLKVLGFDMRIKGDHHIFTRAGVEEIINLQPLGTKAKRYQVKQIRGLILKYHLDLGE